MKQLLYPVIGLVVVVAGVLGWHAITGTHKQASPSSTQSNVAPQENAQSQPSNSQSPSSTTPSGESPHHLGPFSMAGRDYFVELQTKKVQPGAANDEGNTVVAMEIRDAAGAVQYQKSFPYVQGTDDDFQSWSVSAQLLTGTNGTGLLVNYNLSFEPSAPEQEPSGWFQIFGVVNGKFMPFGVPLEVQGGPLDDHAEGHAYKAARALGTQADSFEFKVWTGHCRLIYPVRVDWTQGKLSPAQECTKNSGALSAGCQYKVVPKDKLYTEGVTFVRLWPGPDEKSGQLTKTIVKKDSKVELLTAQVATEWIESKAAAASADSKGPMEDAGSFGVPMDSELWLKVRIDGKEGWMHSEEDFRVLGLPEDE